MALNGQVHTMEEPKLLVCTWGGDTLRFELHPGRSSGISRRAVTRQALEASDLAGEIYRSLGVSWTVPVVLGRHSIKDLAVAALQCSVWHAHKVGDADDGASNQLDPRSQC